MRHGEIAGSNICHLVLSRLPPELEFTSTTGSCLFRLNKLLLLLLFTASDRPDGEKKHGTQLIGATPCTL